MDILTPGQDKGGATQTTRFVYNNAHVHSSNYIYGHNFQKRIYDIFFGRHLFSPSIVEFFSMHGLEWWVGSCSGIVVDSLLPCGGDDTDHCVCALCVCVCVAASCVCLPPLSSPPCIMAREARGPVVLFGPLVGLLCVFVLAWGSWLGAVAEELDVQAEIAQKPEDATKELLAAERQEELQLLKTATQSEDVKEAARMTVDPTWEELGNPKDLTKDANRILDRLQVLCLMPECVCV